MRAVLRIVISYVLAISLIVGGPVQLSAQAQAQPQLSPIETADIHNALLEQESEDFSEKDLPEELESLRESALELNRIKIEDTAQAVNDLIKFEFKGTMTPGEFQIWQRMKTHITMFGVTNTTKRMIQEPLRRMTLSSDPELKVYISMGKYPGVDMIDGGKTLILSLGTFGYARNADEIAAILAVGIERAKGRLSNLSQYHSNRYQTVQTIAQTKNMDPTQLEYLKADLRAIDRLIHAGYNPFALYDIYKRLTKLEYSPWEFRLFKWFYRGWNGEASDFYAGAPHMSLRMSTVKGYIAWRQEQQDLDENLKGYQEFHGLQRIVRDRLYLFQINTTNRAYIRASSSIKKVLYLATAYLSIKIAYTYGMKKWEEAGKTETKQLEKIAEEIEKEPLSATADAVMDYSGTADSVIRGTLQALERYVWQISPEAAEFIASAAEVYFKVSDITGGIRDSLIRSPTPWVLSTICAIMIGLFVRGAVLTYRHQLAQAYSVDAIDTQILKTLKQSTKTIRKLLRDIDLKDPETKIDFVVRMMDVMSGVQNELYRFYMQNSIFTKTLGTGISRALWSSTYSKLRLFAEATQIIEEAPAEKKLEIFNRVSATLDKMNPGMFEGFFSKMALKKFSKLSRSFRDYDIEKISAGFPDEKHPDERLWETNLRLITYPALKMSSEQKIKAMFLMSEKELFKSATTLFGLFRVPIMTYIFSAQNEDKVLPKKLLSFIHRLKSNNGMVSPHMWQNIIHYYGLTGELILRQVTSPKLVDNAGSFSMSRQIPLPRFTSLSIFGNIRYYLNLGKKIELKNFLADKFKNVEQMQEFFNKEFVSRNVIMESYASDLAKVVIQSPEMITSLKDIQTLLREEYFWPKLGQNADKVTGVEAILMGSFLEMKSKYPKTWSYEPAAAEELHNLIIAKLKELKLWSEDLNWKFQLWQNLVGRGVTSTTDLLFLEIYENPQASEHLKAQLEKYATDYGAVWEPRVKGRIAKNVIERFAPYEKLLDQADPTKRNADLKLVVAEMERILPEKDYYFQEMLENLSVKINSNAQEAKFIHEAKWEKVNSNNAQQDVGLRVISDILGDVLNWRKKNQFDFLMYVIGKGPATPKIRNAFKTVGSERIRRMFQLLPVAQKTTFIDTLLDSSTGLLPHSNVNKGYGKKVVNFLLEGRDEAMQKVSRQILEAFFDSLSHAGNKSMGTYILAYILSLPQDETKSAGHVLRSCLEIMGLTGVKIAQFLAASEILSPEDTAILRGSQEKANPPQRHDIFEDLRSIFGGMKMPFDVKEILGSASMKYTMRGIDHKTGKDIAVKIFRKSAFTKANLQFRVLEGMAAYMIKNFGPEYSLVKTIVNASILAVKKELNAQGEVEKSDKARGTIYKENVTSRRRIHVPKDLWVHMRLIGAQFAKGSSIYNQSATSMPAMAEDLLAHENEILFADKEKITFEPDRHAGNYRISAADNGFVNYEVIDFGQLTEITRADRQRIFDLFGLAQILRTIGPTEEAIKFMQTEFSTADVQKLRPLLKMHFSSRKPSELNSYFSLLSALEDSGVKIDPVYLDFIRAILQLKPYETLTTSATGARPTLTFKRNVEASVEKLKTRIQGKLSKVESIRATIKMYKNGDMGTVRASRGATPIRCNMLYR